jgi:hypothetical protein
VPKLSHTAWVWIAIGLGLLVFGGAPAVLFLFLGAIVLGVIGAAYLYYPHVEQTRTLQNLAAQTGGNFVEGDFWLDDTTAMVGWHVADKPWWTIFSSPFRQRWIDYPASRGSLYLKFQDGSTETYGPHPGMYSRLNTPLGNWGAFSFDIRPTAYAGAVTGMDEVELADPDLASAFTLKTSDATMAGALFALPSLRDKMLAVRPLRVAVEIEREGELLNYALMVEDEGWVDNPARLTELRAIRDTVLELLSQPEELARRSAATSAGANSQLVLPEDASPGVSTRGVPGLPDAESGLESQGVPARTDSEPAPAAARSGWETEPAAVRTGWESEPVRQVGSSTDPWREWRPNPASDARVTDPGSKSPGSLPAADSSLLPPQPSPDIPIPDAPAPASGPPVATSLPPSQPPVASPEGTPAPAITPDNSDPAADAARAAEDGSPGVGDTASNDAWAITLAAYRPYDEVANQPVQLSPGRKLVVVDFVLENRQRYTGTLTTSSLSIVDGTGRTIAPAGQTASIDRGFLLTWIQAGQKAEHRAVFELDAAATGLVLKIFELRFRLPD